ncbi:hypothetical protein [Bradyrhizobium barranii]|uniref:hypothetical protein n=1 Tax=Bradyrhizobium TaxID=374 RepID=UPI0007C1B1AB|nr:ATPdependent DNA ligase CDS [Bradyrhizobium sp.]
MIDGEAVLLGVDGVSDFRGLHSGKYNAEVQLYAFDILAGQGDDLRRLPLSHAQGQSGPAAAGPLRGHLHAAFLSRFWPKPRGSEA